MRYDSVYINGKIFTSDKEQPYADAMAVKDGKVVWIGNLTDATVANVGTTGTVEEVQVGENIIDLQGKRVLPGFVDSHMHVIMLANCNKKISVLPPEIYSIDDLIVALRKRREAQGEGAWVEGWGYDEGKLAEGRTPTRWDLDKGCSDAPVEIIRTCAHISVVNSKALEVAGMTKDTPDPVGGKIGRDEHGEPNGIMYETAKEMVSAFKPKQTLEMLVSNVKDLGDILVSQGVTTCADMGEFGYCDYEDIFERAVVEGFKNKVACYYMWDDIKDKPWFTITPEQMSPNKQIRIVGVKLVGDGSVSGRTAWCDKPYTATLNDTEEYGIPVCSEQDFEDAIKFAKDHKCQVSIHCMGSEAIKRAIEYTWQEELWVEGVAPGVY